MKDSKLLSILRRLEVGGQIVMADFFTVLALSRYPMPSCEELETYLHQVAGLGEDRQSFIMTPCWLDEFDEINSKHPSY